MSLFVREEDKCHGLGKQHHEDHDCEREGHDFRKYQLHQIFDGIPVLLTDIDTGECFNNRTAPHLCCDEKSPKHFQGSPCGKSLRSPVFQYDPVHREAVYGQIQLLQSGGASYLDQVNGLFPGNTSETEF